MEIIDRTFERLGAPSATQLRVAVLRAGGEISATQAQQYVARQADTQLFAKRKGGESQTATRDETSDMQADLVDLSQFMGQIRYILVCINPFNRKIALEPLERKTAQPTTAAFRAILQRMKKPQVISTDNDQAFAGPFNAMLEEKNILHRYKRGIDSIAVVDRAIATVKKTLFRRMTRTNTQQFDKFIEETEQGYNEKVHSSLLGSPDDAEGDSKSAKVARFQIMKDNAAKFEKNHEIAERNASAVREAGQFRVEKPKPSFSRGFKPTFENEIRTVREVKAGQVTDESGKTFALNALRAVPQGTINTPAPDFRGRAPREARLREDLKEFAKSLYDALGGEDLALTSAARMMPEEFSRTKPTHMSFGQFLALYPNLFRITGEGTRKKVRAIRRRVTRKRAVV